MRMLEIQSGINWVRLGANVARHPWGTWLCACHEISNLWRQYRNSVEHIVTCCLVEIVLVRHTGEKYDGSLGSRVASGEGES